MTSKCSKFCLNAFMRFPLFFSISKIKYFPMIRLLHKRSSFLGHKIWHMFLCSHMFNIDTSHVRILVNQLNLRHDLIYIIYFQVVYPHIYLHYGTWSYTPIDSARTMCHRQLRYHIQTLASVLSVHRMRWLLYYTHDDHNKNAIKIIQIIPNKSECMCVVDSGIAVKL